jgi:hypothetical protein
VVLLGRATLQLVLDFLDPADGPAGRFAEERTFPPELLNQVMGNVPELGGKVLMDIQDVHGRIILATRRLVPARLRKRLHRVRTPIHNLQPAQKPDVDRRSTDGRADRDLCSGITGRATPPADSL